MIGLRLKLFCEKKGITAYRIAKDAGLSPQTVSYILQGKSATSDTLEKLLFAFPDLNGHWLLTGRGEMLESSGEKVGA